MWACPIVLVTRRHLSSRRHLIMITRIYRDLEDGAIVTALGYDIIIQRRSLGLLSLPTGQLVACDPLTHPSTEPFDILLDPGDYPIKLVIAELRDEARIAYAVIEVQPEPARRWQLACVPGEEPSATTGEAHGYSVISGLGSFMDADTAARLMEYTELMMYDEDEIARLLHAQLRKTTREGWSFAKVEHPYLGQGNIAAFTAGFGEGLYRTYLGHDQDGELTRIVTDFEVLDMRFPSFRF